MNQNIKLLGYILILVLFGGGLLLFMMNEPVGYVTITLCIMLIFYTIYGQLKHKK